MNVYLLFCISIQAIVCTVHSFNIHRLGMNAILKSGMCLFWIVFCMVSMVIVTRTYMMTTLEKDKNPVIQFNSNNRLYLFLLTLNTVFASIALTTFIFR